MLKIKLELLPFEKNDLPNQVICQEVLNYVYENKDTRGGRQFFDWILDNYNNDFCNVELTIEQLYNELFNDLQENYDNWPMELSGWQQKALTSYVCNEIWPKLIIEATTDYYNGILTKPKIKCE